MFAGAIVGKTFRTLTSVRKPVTTVWTNCGVTLLAWKILVTSSPLEAVKVVGP